jgi:TonB-linked SusC/RagA family outer membrane protein
MLKTVISGWPTRGGTGRFTKALFVMKLTIILLTAGFLNVSAAGISQNVTFTGKNVSLGKVFSSVEDQTGYFFLYPKTVLKQAAAVTVQAENMPLSQFLELVFKNQPLKYYVGSKTITVSLSDAIEKNTPAVVASASPPLAFPIRGVIRNADGEPVAANIMIKGTKNGVSAAADGSFTINAEAGDILVITSVGYQPTEYRVSNTPPARPIDIALQRSTNPLDEVQVIAYGTTSQRLSTGNVQSVKAKDIEKQPVQNPILALQGRVPGITIDQVSGMPGGAAINVRIQGQISLNKGSLPLYVIDGVPFSPLYYMGGVQVGIYNGTTQNGDIGESAVGSPLSLIDPSQIESITVLKDADATSIYGSLAAAGAILITTKKGKAGKTKVDLNVQNGWGKAATLPKMMNTQQYLAMRKAAYVNDGLTVPDASIPTNQKNASNYDLTLWDQNRYTDWTKVLLGNTAQFTNLTGTVSGGNANTQYLLSGTYNAQGTVFPNNKKVEMMAGHLNVTNVSSNQKFRTSADVKYSVTQNNLPDIDLTGIALQLPPNAPALYRADTLNWEPDPLTAKATWANPLAKINSYITKVVSNNLIADMVLSYQLLPGLNIQSSFGYTDLQRHERASYPSLTVEPAARPTYTGGTNFAESNLRSFQIQPQLNFQQSVGNSKLELLAGLDFYNRKSNGFYVYGSGYTNDLQLGSLAAAPVKGFQRETNTDYRYYAVFGKISYNWLNKYLLSASIRRDGSSRFGSNSRFHNFAAIGAGWIFSEEKLVKDHLGFLSFGKLKGSYGSTGNDQIGDYQYLSLYSPIGVANPYQGVPGYNVGSLPNPNLQWEETRKLSLSLELGFLKDRILLSGTYFRNRSSNQLQSTKLPPSTGFTDFQQNLPAMLQNSGVELTVSGIVVQSKMITWNTNANLTIPQNKLVNFPDIENTSFATTLKVGEPFIGRTYLFKYAGLNANTGNFSFQKADGSITDNSNLISPSTDRIGSIVYTTPKYYGGLQNSFTYRGFQIDFLFQITKQIAQLAMPNTRFGVSSSNGGSTNGNQPAWALDYWTKPGDDVLYQKPSLTSGSSRGWSIFKSADVGYVDASYIRFKNLALSYQLPDRWKKAIHMDNARFFINGQNLLTLTHYEIDPETRSFTVLPPLRVITMGFQVTF